MLSLDTAIVRHSQPFAEVLYTPSALLPIHTVATDTARAEFAIQSAALLIDQLPAVVRHLFFDAITVGIEARPLARFLLLSMRQDAVRR